MSLLPKVTIIGAGFSGLVSAYYFIQAGYEVDLYESSDRVGGLIQTLSTPAGRIETAANGLLASELLEGLCDKIGVRLVQSGRTGKKRYIFRDGRPQRWPLSFLETTDLVMRLVKARGKPPLPQETVKDWTLRVLGSTAYLFLLTPALQGIYAGNPEVLSAELVFVRLFQKKAKVAGSRFRGTVAPRLGMSELIEKLKVYLVSKGMRLHFRAAPSLRLLTGPVVIATSLPAAVRILAESFPGASQILSKVEMVPLVSVNLSFPKASPHLEGFGCVFARDEGVRSLGVLFEESIFGGRSDDHLERWIMGGATDQDIISLSDEEILHLISEDRAKLLGEKRMRTSPLAFHVTRWKAALPHYTLVLQSALVSPEVSILAREKNIYLLGNYTGKLGLSGILETASSLPRGIGAKECLR